MSFRISLMYFCDDALPEFKCLGRCNAFGIKKKKIVNEDKSKSIIEIFVADSDFICCFFLR